MNLLTFHSGRSDLDLRARCTLKFRIFIGIDQTGATSKNGLPRPLHVSIIDGRLKKFKYYTGLKLSSLTFNEVTQLLDKTIGPVKTEKVLICVDSVLGLPAELSVPHRKIRSDVKNYSFANKNYGAITAFNFFRSYLKSELIPHRRVEVQVKANSVFNLKPFQRNIGCGSYRVHRDLAHGKKWFSVWPFEPLVKQFIISEGYPSYFWKKHVGSKTRHLDSLQLIYKNLNFENMDQADSFVLALGASKNFDQIVKSQLTKQIRSEGWILGVPIGKN